MDEAWDARDQLDDLALNQRHEHDENAGNGNQKEDHDDEAGEAARDAAPLEPGNAGRQDIGDHKASREGQQNALHEAQRDDDENQEA